MPTKKRVRDRRKKRFIVSQTFSSLFLSFWIFLFFFFGFKFIIKLRYSYCYLDVLLWGKRKTIELDLEKIFFIERIRIHSDYNYHWLFPFFSSFPLLSTNRKKAIKIKLKKIIVWRAHRMVTIMYLDTSAYPPIKPWTLFFFSFFVWSSYHSMRSNCFIFIFVFVCFKNIYLI